MQLTETVRARTHFTPQSSALFDDASLSARLGQGTVAGGLNDQVRFRFDTKGGAPSSWKLVPDNELSATLLASRSGPLLERKVQRMLGNLNAADAAGLLNVRGIMLADDEQSWAAGWLLQQRDATANGTPAMPPMSMKETYGAAKLVTHLADAQAIQGWVHFPPDVARNILTSVGAYTPAQDERVARSASFASEGLPGIFGHELHHRVSEADFTSPAYMPLEWMEEGTVTLLAMHHQAQNENVRAWNTSAHSHAGHVAAPDHTDLGWGSWKRDQTALERSGVGDKVQGNYHTSVDTLQHLVRLSGLDPTADADRPEVFDLLQGTDVSKVPARLAEAILDAQGIQRHPAARSTLAAAITGSNSGPGLKVVDDVVAGLRDAFPARP